MSRTGHSRWREQASASPPWCPELDFGCRWYNFLRLMKRLHQQFNQEDIVINYPNRTLQFPKEWSPETMALRNGEEPANRTDGKNAGRNDRSRHCRRRSPKELYVPRNFGEGPDSVGDRTEVG